MIDRFVTLRTLISLVLPLFSSSFAILTEAGLTSLSGALWTLKNIFLDVEANRAVKIIVRDHLA